MGRAFLLNGQAETVSHFDDVKWDVLSLGARFGNCIPVWRSRTGHTFPRGLFGKLRPRIPPQNGTDFPLVDHRESASQFDVSERDALSL